MESKRKYFEVVVAGQYIALNSVSGTQTLKNYQESFILPSQEAALSKICKHLLSPRLKKMYADFIRYRTHEQVSITLHNYTPDPAVLQMTIDDMNLTELSDFCILRQLNIDPVVHAEKKDIFAIRQMVLKANEDKRQYMKDKQTSKNAPEEKEAEELRKLNDLQGVRPGVQINENEQLVKKNVVQTPAARPAALSTTAPGSNEPLESDDPLPPPEIDGPIDSQDPFAA